MIIRAMVLSLKAYKIMFGHKIWQPIFMLSSKADHTGKAINLQIYFVYAR